MDDKEKAELERYRAAEKRNELIEVEMRKRSELCNGAIPADQLREIAGRQVDHDAALAKAAAPAEEAPKPVAPKPPAASAAK
jgi:hypothetical protein